MADLPRNSTDYEANPEPQPPVAEPLPFWLRWSELLIAAIVIGLGVLILVETQDIRMTPMSRVSPRTIPLIVGGGLVLVGIWYAIEIVRSPYTGHGEESEDIDPEAETDWLVIAAIGFGLVCYAMLMEYAGFIIASAVLFFISAFAMGSRKFPRDASIAILLAVAIFLLFDTWLGVRLPAGEIAGWISWE